MKKISLVLLCLLIIGCGNKEKDTTIFEIDNDSYIYGEEIILSDVINDERIKDLGKTIDTTKLGKQEIHFEYEDNNKIKKGKAEINIIDKEEPIIFSSSKYYIKIGVDIDLLKKPIYGDNADRNVKLEVIGQYNINELGEYPLQFIVTDSSGNEKIKDFILAVVNELPISNNTVTNLKIEDFIAKHKTDNTQIGIDVSVWQGDIDFEKVKQAGVEFVMIRIGYGYFNDEIKIDNRFLDNIKKAKEASLPVGIYFYSYASNEQEAIEQAKWVVETLDGQILDLPIAFDWEIWDKFSSLNINFLDLNNIATSFLNTIKEHGYKAINYSSMNYLNAIWDIDEYPTWLAHYTKNTDKSSYDKDYYIWQASDKGKVDGINANVDLNILYK